MTLEPDLLVPRAPAAPAPGGEPPKPRYSFVLPVFNEAETLPTLRARMITFLDGLDAAAEVLLIDDGSKDRSYALMKQLSLDDPRFKVLRLSRNFGHQVAITAGIDFALGDAVIVMDADLQDPPEVVLQMIEEWKKGYGVVYGKRAERRGETAFKKFTAHVFYRVLKRLSEVDIPTDVGDFRLMDRSVVDAFKAMREQNRYVRGMIAWLGFSQTAVEYVRDERIAGETKYPFRKMLRLAVNGIVGFSTVPLRFISTLGFVVSALSFLFGLGAIAVKVIGLFTVPGWTSTLVVVFFMGGVQLVVLGVIGEYLGRISDEVKRRPLYLIAAADGFDRRARLQVPPDAVVPRVV